MSNFENLEIAVDKLRESYNAFKQGGNDISADKPDGQEFSVQDACEIVEEFLDVFKQVRHNRKKFVRRISEIDDAVSQINTVSNYFASGDSVQISGQIDRIIFYIRIFENLLMEKMNNVRHAQTSDMENVLRELRQYHFTANQISSKLQERDAEIKKQHESVQQKANQLDEDIAKNTSTTQDLENLITQAQQNAEQVKAICDGAQGNQKVIEQFTKLINERQNKISEQNVATDNYETKLDDFSKEHESLISYYKSKHDSSFSEIKTLIKQAETALKHAAAAGLSGAFIQRKEELSYKRVKGFWLFILLCASAGAIWLGWEAIKVIGESGNSGIGVLVRALILFVALGVATFAGNQYAKNKTVEEDYAYKAALIASYPGLAKEFGEADEELRKQYVHKLLNEVLQDPQRKRKESKPIISRFNPENDK